MESFHTSCRSTFWLERCFPAVGASIHKGPESVDMTDRMNPMGQGE